MWFGMAGDNVVKQPVTTALFWLVYLRSFFLQGSFSVRDRQNIGFAFCMEPLGKRLYKGEDHKRFLARHLEHYNGNPFMTPLVIGAVMKMEVNHALSGSPSADEIVRFKNAVGKATGAVGDRFFWRTLRPFGLVLGLTLVFFYGLTGVELFLLTFNIPTLLLRWHWLVNGYRLGPRIVIEIKNPLLQQAARIMETVGAAILAFLTVVFFGRYPGYTKEWISSGAVLLFVLTLILLKLRIPHGLVFPAIAVLTLIAGLCIHMLL